MCIKHLVFCLLFLPVLALNSQNPRKRVCHSPVPPPEWDQWFNGLVQKQRETQSTDRSATTSYTIPVIVHVIHSGEPTGTYPNISREQILSQIDILNADFSGNGFNSTNVPWPFQASKANCNIVFSMAELDPDGNELPEAGIERINWKDIGMNANPYRPFSSSGFQVFFDDSIKPATIWDPRRYFNIWLSDRRATLDLLGYSTFPVGANLQGIFNGNGDETNDGVYIWPKAFGNVGVLDPDFNLGRTATHEIGHWLGLRHIWGDSNCGDDYCEDTPPQQTSNFNCPVFPKVSCGGPNGDMFMNFMDYCDDGCLVMFTWNQLQRMQTAMEFGTFRKELTASSLTVCNVPWVSVKEREAEAFFSVAPNPASSFVNLRSQVPLGQVLLLDLAGRVVKCEQFRQELNYRLDLSDVPEGLYFVKVDGSQFRSTRKIAVRH